MGDALRSLMDDLSDIPPDYIRDVALTKRFFECWVMDPVFRASFEADPAAALATLGPELHPGQILPFIEQARPRLESAGPLPFLELGNPALGNASLHREDPADDPLADAPLAARRYQAFVLEKLQYRARMREGSMPDEPRMAAWRRRQVNRCVGELGSARAEAIVHAPAAFELAKGCTVGCWFCGVAAPKFDHTWPHTPQTAPLWRETLAVLRDVIGACAQHAFLYWATDPLDNPDYERFLTDFYEVLGRCPQTTTALAQKDIERTRRLLRLVRSMNSTIDRFSIIALNSLHRVHDGLSAEEMLRVECVPQNREAAWLYRKSGAGRARQFAHKRQDEMAPPELGSTIACVSGFLFNMIDRSVKLITPCNANDRWPLGYWVLSQGTFGSPGELRELLRSMIADLRSELRVTDVIRLRPDLRLEPGRDQLHVRSLELRIAFDGQPCLDHLAELLSAGSYTAADIAWTRQRVDGVPLAQTFALLSELFDQGLTDEEPAVPQVAVPEPAGPDGAHLAAQAAR